MFKGRERVAATVTRWSTTPHIRPQSVMEHTGFVVLYTNHITKLLNWPMARRFAAAQWAAIHDMPEVVLSDWPGPVKRMVADKNQLRRAEELVFAELGVGYELDYSDFQTRQVVKVANLIDELFYLQNEINLGNKYVNRVMANTWARLYKALKPLCLNDLADTIKYELGQMQDGIVSLITLEDPHG